MIDTVSVYSNNTIAAAQTTESNFVEIDLSAKTTWSQIALHIKVTNGAGGGNPGDHLQIFTALTSFAGITSGASLRASARPINIRLSADANGVAILNPQLGPAHGSSLYVWLAHDSWAAPRTIDIFAAGAP